MSKKSKIIVALGLVYVVWGSTFLGVKYAIHELPPMLLSALRFLVGGIILFVFTILRGDGFPKFINWKGSVVVGLLLTGIGNSVVANALKFMPSGLVALLVATLPAWMLLLDFLFFSHKKPSYLSSIGLILGFVGMAYLVLPNNSTLNHASIGTEIALFPTLLVFTGSISWAYGSLLSPTFNLPPALQSTAIQMIAGGAFALVISLVIEQNQWQSIRNMSQQTYLAMAYLIFIGSFVGYTAYTWLINNAPTEVTATYAYVNPVVAIFLGWLFIDETLSTKSLVASIIVLIGVVLMTMGNKKKQIINKAS